jgi:hypothetical protein
MAVLELLARATEAWVVAAGQHGIGRQNEAETARNPLFAGLSGGALGEIRTPDPRIRSPMLYPAEPRATLPQTLTVRAPEQFLVVIITTIPIRPIV